MIYCVVASVHVCNGTRWGENQYRNACEQVPSLTVAAGSERTYFSPLNLCSSTVVPVFVERSSIVSCDLLDRSCYTRCQPSVECEFGRNHTLSPFGTSPTRIVMCRREIVLWEMANCPAV